MKKIEEKDAVSPGTSQAILSIFREAFKFINPRFNSYPYFSGSHLNRETKNKEGNIQYSFDLKLEDIFVRGLKAGGYGGLIFSEESGFFKKMEGKFIIIIDPFCNSILASRMFLQGAAGMSIFSSSYDFLAAGILDYQTGISAVAKGGEVSLHQIQTGDEVTVPTPDQNRSIAEAWFALALQTRERRREDVLDRLRDIMKNSSRIIIGSGHFYWLKLILGSIDAYVDISKGQELYEMFAAVVAQKSGCVVTDETGADFDASAQLKIFKKNPKTRFRVIAARNKELHGEIISSLSGRG